MINFRVSVHIIVAEVSKCFRKAKLFNIFTIIIIIIIIIILFCPMSSLKEILLSYNLYVKEFNSVN